MAITVVINRAPFVDAGPNRSIPEGGTVGLDGTVSDADGDPMTIVWSFTPLSGVDVGATCTFSGANPVDRNVSCSDDGTYTLTLTASDGIDTRSDTMILTVANRPPSVVITSPTTNQPFNPNSSVSVSATISDPGANDTETCSIAWGDGTTTAGVVDLRVCSASHS